METKAQGAVTSLKRGGAKSKYFCPPHRYLPESGAIT